MAEQAPMLIINADDLGRTPNVNSAIASAFSRGLISSASVMANMAGFEEACEIARARGLVGRVGVHLNLTQGLSMSRPIRDCARLCQEDGTFLPRGGVLWRLRRDEIEAVAAELRSQISAVVKEGISPTHLDSHHHVHTQWPIIAIVMTVAREFRIPVIRISRNCGPHLSLAKRVYKAAFNGRLGLSGVTCTRYFGSAADVLSIDRISGSAEVMVHPEIDPSGHLVDCWSGASRFDTAIPLEAAVAGLESGARVVSVSEFARAIRGT